MSSATLNPLLALSPLDGRYQKRTQVLQTTFSEFALIRNRLKVEVEWFIKLADWPAIPEFGPVSDSERAFLRGLIDNFDLDTAQRIKTIESHINHDVKAVEYFLKESLAETSLAEASEFVHFACTSEDINNLAHALMLQEGVGRIWVSEAETLVAALSGFAEAHRHQAMLAHTHGQPASPTTVGKEMAVFSHRLSRQLQMLKDQPYLGKINGAVGNFNAHHTAYPQADWPTFAQGFVEYTLGLNYNHLTTQIESHDYIAEIFHTIARFNTILLDFNNDVWLYISKGYFKERVKIGEVGSSTMPHKVNPIDFENSEGNLHLSNALLNSMAQKLAVSRWQRDLSDSTMLRNMGVAVGYSLVALKSSQRGLKKLSVNEAKLQSDLNQAWAVLAEPIQTIMRRAGLENPYEQLKAFSRGKALSQSEIKAFIENLPLSEKDKESLLALEPALYIGLADKLF